MTKQIPPEVYASDAAFVEPVEEARRLRKGEKAVFPILFDANLAHLQRFALARLANDDQTTREVAFDSRNCAAARRAGIRSAGAAGALSRIFSPRAATRGR